MTVGLTPLFYDLSSVSLRNFIQVYMFRDVRTGGGVNVVDFFPFINTFNFG